MRCFSTLMFCDSSTALSSFDVLRAGATHAADHFGGVGVGGDAGQRLAS